jgi:ADP-ribosylglycohydrolase
LEFRDPGTFKPITDMVGGGPFRLNPGEWTDDTSMALCLAASLVEKEAFDPVDQLMRYSRWTREGYMSSNGYCFDVGGTVSHALRTFHLTGQPNSGPVETYSAGNGSLMRLAPIPMYYANDAQAAIHYSGESSRTTHGTTACLDACRYFGGLLVGALRGASKEELLSPYYTPLPGTEKTQRLYEEIAEIANGSFKTKSPPEIRGTGYVVRSLEAALWAFYHGHDFRSGCLMAVNLGDDADTTGAIYGQIAGAYYGAEGIPPAWREKLAKRTVLIDLAMELFDLSGCR